MASPTERSPRREETEEKEKPSDQAFNYQCKEVQGLKNMFKRIPNIYSQQNPDYGK